MEGKGHITFEALAARPILIPHKISSKLVLTRNENSEGALCI